MDQLPIKTPKHLWRADVTSLMFEGECIPRVYIDFTMWHVEKRTPKGVWIHYGLDKKFVLLYGRKRFAYPTKEEALESLIARKKRQIRIINYQKEVATIALEKADELRRAGIPDGREAYLNQRIDCRPV